MTNKVICSERKIKPKVVKHKIRDCAKKKLFKKSKIKTHALLDKVLLTTLQKKLYILKLRQKQVFFVSMT